MKTIKNVLAASLLMITMGAFATNDKVIVAENVTITKAQEKVSISVLNTQHEDFTLFIYSASGDLVFKGNLGTEVSLGKSFDFSNAASGLYTFKVVSAKGTSTRKSIKIG